MDAVILDVEVYTNYLLLGFKSTRTGKVVQFERGEGRNFDPARVLNLLKRHLTVGFNSRTYDLAIIYAALAGYSTKKLKIISDKIIQRNMRSWDVEREFGFKIGKIDHIDLIEVAPGKASLKIYGGRLHSKRMQSLPVAHDAVLTEEQIETIKTYNVNDLDTTIELYHALAEQLELRSHMSEEYGEDLRSKSDAQIAEAVIRSQVEKIAGDRPTRQTIKPGTSFRYQPPAYISFKTKQLQDMFKMVCDSEFVIADSGKVVMPKVLEDERITIGFSVYRMGIGGLHSSEKTTAHVKDGDTLLKDADVTSYYPSLILTLGLAPEHLGEPFLRVYSHIKDSRVKAKREKNKVVDKCFKIVLNGSFGKFGSKWSCLYSPNLLIQVTITGQLDLLMLIEAFELAGIRVVSANTDGVVAAPRRDQEQLHLDIIKQWELATGLEMEVTEYDALYSRDVNNYLAIKPDGSVKAKGAYATPFVGKKYEPNLMKSPQSDIATVAVVNLMTKGVPIGETIYGCRDIRQFLSIRTVKGGAVKDDIMLGGAIRWYYGTSTTSAIHYVVSGNKVPRTEGAVPILDLPETFPEDIDYGWYIREAHSIMEDISYYCADEVYDI